MADKLQSRVRLFGRQSRRVGSFAMVQPHRGSSATAALRKVGEVKDERSKDAAWQTKAYELVEAVGEIGHVLNMKASMIAACDLQPQKWDPKDRRWEKTDDERALRVMAAFTGPHGGQTELKRRAALHLSIGGESILLGTPAEPGSVETGVWWEFLSTDELRIGNDGVWRRRDGGQREEVDGSAYLSRLWRAHPQFSDLADSEMRRSLELAQEVQLLGQVNQAVLRSRLAAGLLFVPEEISFVGDDEPDAAGEDDIDDFINDLVEHMSAPITDRTSAASLVPLTMRGPAEAGDKIHLIDLARDLDTFAQDLRREGLGRLARSLDVPPEFMEGKGDVNHWGAWNLDTDLVTRYAVPPGQLLADFTTVSYLRPMLEEFEDVDPKESAAFRLALDPTNIMTRHDEAGSTRALWSADATLVSSEALRKANGVNETDKPTPEEVFERRAWELIRSQPAVFAKALLPKLSGFEEIDVDQLGQPEPEPGEDGPGVPAAPGAMEAPVGAAAQGPPDPTGRPGNASELVVKLCTLADATVDRAIERASSKVVTRAKSGAPDLRDRLAAVPKRDVLCTVTRADLATMGVSTDHLVAGAWDQLVPKARLWIGEELRAAGVDALTADDRAALAASQLADGLDAWLRTHLHDRLWPGSGGYVMPRSVVLAALTDASVGSLI